MRELYGTYRNMTFSDVFPSEDEFMENYNLGIIPKTISDSSAKTAYYLLAAEYANSPISSSDVERFKLKVLQILFTDGPTWEYKLKVQDKLRSMIDDEEELLSGAKQINNYAGNPGNVLDEATYKGGVRTVNQQTVSMSVRNKLDAYAMVYDLLKNDVTKIFLQQFKKLFLTMATHEKAEIYITKIDEDEEDYE